MLKINWRIMVYAGLFPMILISCGGSGSKTELAPEPEKVSVTTTAPEPATESPAANPAEKQSGGIEASDGLSITSVRKEEKGKYSATLNGALVFKDLEIRKDDDGKELLFFPKSQGKGDKEYSMVYLNDRSIAVEIKKAIKEGKAEGKGSPKALKVTAVKWRDIGGQSKVKGFADVTFNDAITIKGCKLIEGKDGHFVGWPSVKKGNEYEDLIFATDKSVRDAVEAAIKKEAGL